MPIVVPLEVTMAATTTTTITITITTWMRDKDSSVQHTGWIFIEKSCTRMEITVGAVRIRRCRIIKRKPCDRSRSTFNENQAPMMMMMINAGCMARATRVAATTMRASAATMRASAAAVMKSAAQPTTTRRRLPIPQRTKIQTLCLVTHKLTEPAVFHLRGNHRSNPSWCRSTVATPSTTTTRPTSNSACPWGTGWNGVGSFLPGQKSWNQGLRFSGRIFTSWVP
mmetsp:Transcript_2952/g.8056  ORF Transcript_2952/g.8056 Transcript_2952/m.8056 type:complete len:225 (+) Transcript_2952:492-1166(+)